MNDNVFYTTNAVCRSYELDQDIVNEMVSWGIAEPLGNKPEKWIFTQGDFERIGQASRIRNELDINIPGAALAVQFLDDIQILRNKEC